MHSRLHALVVFPLDDSIVSLCSPLQVVCFDKAVRGRVFRRYLGVEWPKGGLACLSRGGRRVCMAPLSRRSKDLPGHHHPSRPFSLTP
jgi:hypothetical protein